MLHRMEQYCAIKRVLSNYRKMHRIWDYNIQWNKLKSLYITGSVLHERESKKIDNRKEGDRFLLNGKGLRDGNTGNNGREKGWRKG